MLTGKGIYESHAHLARRYWRTAEVVARDMLPGVQHLQLQQQQQAAQQQDDSMADDLSLDGDEGPPSTEAQGVPAMRSPAQEADSRHGITPVAMDATPSGGDAAAAAGASIAGQDAAAVPQASTSGASTAAEGGAPGLPAAVIEEMVGRQRIVELVCSGDIDAALNLVWERYGRDALQNHGRLYFHLKVSSSCSQRSLYACMLCDAAACNIKRACTCLQHVHQAVSTAGSRQHTCLPCYQGMHLMQCQTCRHLLPATLASKHTPLCCMLTGAEVCGAAAARRRCSRSCFGVRPL